MLGVIVQHSVEIVTFISWLSLALYQPQIRHLIQLVDALLVCDSRKTLTNLYRQLAAGATPKRLPTFSARVPGRSSTSADLANVGCCSSCWSWPAS